jgi:hypothetical protein
MAKLLELLLEVQPSGASLPLPPKRLGMEPVAGLGHFSPRLRLKYAPFSLVNQV